MSLAPTLSSPPTDGGVLVIKLGALGDIIQALGAFQDIRRHHPGDRVVLLTTPPFVGLTARMPWFDEIWPNGRAKISHPAEWLRLILGLRRAGFHRVYDLQCNDRTATFFHLLAGPRRPEWVGTVKGCAFPLPPQPADRRHNSDLMRAQLAVASVPHTEPTDLGWLDADTSAFALPDRFVLMVPGCSPHLLHKRWPPAAYAALAARMAARGYRSVVVGTAADREAIDEIKGLQPDVIDLSGRTTLFELAAVARRAAAVVGNDTGPVFLSATLGAPTLMLMSHHTDPSRSAPRGPLTAWLKRDTIADLTVDEVETALLFRPS